MTPNQQKAIELYDAASRGRCGFGISGDSMRDTRQAIMHLLTGVKMPKSQCGTNAVEDAVTKAKNFALPGMETADDERAGMRAEAKAKAPANDSRIPSHEELHGMKATAAAPVQVVAVPQLFPTPPELAARMVEAADIAPGHSVLEPSAGTGAILAALPTVRPDGHVTAVEISSGLLYKLEPFADEIVCGDFLQQNGNLGKFDRILMNPPFANAQDIAHIQHAVKFLKPGGRLVAICAGGPRQHEQLKPIAATWEPLPAGTFKDSGTNVNTVLLTIEA